MQTQQQWQQGTFNEGFIEGFIESFNEGFNESFNVSYSAIDTYQRCPRKYQWAYQEGWTKATYEASPASLGSAIHAGIAFCLHWFHQTGYDGNEENLRTMQAFLHEFFEDWAEVNAPEEIIIITSDGETITDGAARQEFFQMVDNAMVITLRTLDHLDVPNNWRTVELDGKPLIEYKDTVHLGSHLLTVEPLRELETTLTFQIDWVAQHIQTGMVYVVDWKSRKTFQPNEYEQAIGGEDFNFQISLYAAAMEGLGVHVNGTITYQIAPYVPEWPVLIKNGRVSKANIRSDWATYSAAVRANNESPADPYYEDMREKLDKQVWWSPVTIYRSEYELNKRWEWAQHWAYVMWDDAYSLPVENIMCRMCPFAQLCIGVDRDLDLDSIKEMGYTKKVGKEQKEVTDD